MPTMRTNLQRRALPRLTYGSHCALLQAGLPLDRFWEVLPPDAVAHLPAAKRSRLIAAGMLTQLPARVEAEASLSVGATKATPATPAAAGAARGPCWVRKALAQTDDEFVSHFDGFSAGLRERCAPCASSGARSRVFELCARWCLD